MRSPSDIAAELGISLPQFYRDRRKACTRVAQALLRRQRVGMPSDIRSDLDGLRLRRASSLIDQGFASAALSDLADLLRHATSPKTTVTALAEMSRANFDLGNLARAEQSCKSARAYLARPDNGIEDKEILDCRIGIEEFQIASVTRLPSDAYSVIAPLAAGHGWREHVSAEWNELAIELLVETCHAAVLAGRIPEAQKAIDRSTAIAQHHAMPLVVYSQIAAMRAYAYAGGGGPNSNYSLDVLFEALDLAKRAGSAYGMLTATILLVDYCVSLNYEDRAKRYAASAYTLAESMDGTYITPAACDSLAGSLLLTKYWESAEDLTKNIGDQENTYYAMRSELFRGQLLSRRGEYDLAIRHLNNANEYADGLQSLRTKALALSEMALAEYVTDRNRRAKKHMNDGLDVLQTCNSPSVRRFGLAAAGKILQNGKPLF